MSQTLWVALGLVLIVEGLGPLIRAERMASDGGTIELTTG